MRKMRVFFGQITRTHAHSRRNISDRSKSPNPTYDHAKLSFSSTSLKKQYRLAPSLRNANRANPAEYINRRRNHHHLGFSSIQREKLEHEARKLSSDIRAAALLGRIITHKHSQCLYPARTRRLVMQIRAREPELLALHTNPLRERETGNE